MPQQTPRRFQRNAFAPGLLGAIALFLVPLFASGDGLTVFRYIITILALIVAWFSVQARQWWWTIVFVAVAVLWNPAFPIALDGYALTGAVVLPAIAFIVAGVLIKTFPEEEK